MIKISEEKLKEYTEEVILWARLWAEPVNDKEVIRKWNEEDFAKEIFIKKFPEVFQDG